MQRIIPLLFIFLFTSCSFFSKRTYDPEKPKITLKLKADQKEKICHGFEMAIKNQDASPISLCQMISLAYSNRKNPHCYDTYTKGEAVCIGLGGFLCKELLFLGQGLCMALDGKFCSASVNDAQGICNALGAPYCSVLKYEDNEKWFTHFKNYCKNES